jgi:hypothetical protein
MGRFGNGDGHSGLPSQNGVQGRVADLLLDLFGQAPGVVVPHPPRRRRPVRRLQPPKLTTELHQHHQQGRDVGHPHGVGKALAFFGIHHDHVARSLSSRSGVDATWLWSRCMVHQIDRIGKYSILLTDVTRSP